MLLWHYKCIVISRVHARARPTLLQSQGYKKATDLDTKNLHFRMR